MEQALCEALERAARVGSAPKQLEAITLDGNQLDPTSESVVKLANAQATIGQTTISKEPITCHASLITYHVSLIAYHSPLVTQHSALTMYHSSRIAHHLLLRSSQAVEGARACQGQDEYHDESLGPSLDQRIQPGVQQGRQQARQRRKQGAGGIRRN